MSPFCRRGQRSALLPRCWARRGAPRCFASLSSHSSPRRCLTASWTTPSSAATAWTGPSWSFWSAAWRRWRRRSPRWSRRAWRPPPRRWTRPAACACSRPGACVAGPAGARGCRGPRVGRRTAGGSGRSRGSWRSRTSSCRGRCRPLSPERCGPGSAPPWRPRTGRWTLAPHTLEPEMRNCCRGMREKLL